ncbi:DUF3558 domain-containing protein [Saccharopolyspora rhizosphaerae]|uniref:DUF3558 domain-containing protein n=1 Tax=Saccharopolyspora rhizosphaerae TaxID=2492662 RepID=A0A426JST8_9PSEU|nr:DUF3558 family protein [Saccharopolyspora rhizosphaerae]RRO16242.1 DUF3558 domain-containing protein [Saccharopolyspora rhizosphaerae]
MRRLPVRLGSGFAAAVASAAAVIALAGCTVNGPDPAPPPATPASPDLPQRPGELPVAGKQDSDVCTWMSVEQLTSLQVGPGEPLPKDGSNYNGCGYLGDTGAARFAIGVRIVPEAIDLFLGKINSSPGTCQSYELNGFGAVQSQINGGESLGCDAFVDAAPGQTVWVNMQLQTPNAMTADQMCEKAQTAAHSVVSTLQARS